MIDFNEMELLALFRRRNIEGCEMRLKQRYARVDRLLAKLEHELVSRNSSEDGQPDCNPEQVKHLRRAIVNLVEFSIELVEAKANK
jgi:hypothetical protein